LHFIEIKTPFPHFPQLMPLLPKETQVKTDVALAGKTTLKIGGNARFYLQPEKNEDIEKSQSWAKAEKLPVFMLGNGSKALISDSGWPGLVLDVGAGLGGCVWEGTHAVCGAGALLHRLIREMLDRGFCGLETLGGIPGSIGGAVFMNAGAYGHSISECVESVDFYDFSAGMVRTFLSHELRAEYRRTVFSTMQAAIISCRFRFRQDAAHSASGIFSDCLTKRKQKHPLDLPNCGSVFKNPQTTPAAKLIESCGLKGYRKGDIEISSQHANFIVNLGRGRSDDARHVIVHAQKTVYEKHGILLEPEVVFVGEFSEPLFTPH
jgi:UDP-N-acetylmuramate dehydrogenase